MKLIIGLGAGLWTAAVLVSENFFSTQGGGTITAALILTLVPLAGTTLNGWVTRRQATRQHRENIDKATSIERKVDGTASTLAASEKASTELAKAVETGRINELEATIAELRKHVAERRG